MEPVSFWQLVLNNPEWVAALASIIFASVTVGVLIWQVCVMQAQVRVMRWQARTSARYEHSQNRLLRLQHEHEWLGQRNRERKELLHLTRKLHLAVGCLLNESPSSLESIHWAEVLDIAPELDARLSILDIATFTGSYDQWFFNLREYVGAVLKDIIEEPNVQFPSPETKRKLKDADEHPDPIRICLDL